MSFGDTVLWFSTMGYCIWKQNLQGSDSVGKSKSNVKQGKKIMKESEALAAESLTVSALRLALRLTVRRSMRDYHKPWLSNSINQ